MSNLFLITLRVMKHVTIRAENPWDAMEQAMSEEDAANVISVDVEDQYGVTEEGNIIQ